MELMTLDIQNFKGIKKQTIQADGQSLVISGRNATGKTTMLDAYIWLLFGKDSTDRAQFSVKPMDADNNEIHNIVVSVRGVFRLEGGEVLELKRELKEEWSRTRGTTETKYKNTTDYYINGITQGVSKAQYETRIRQIVDPDMFKIVSNALYFMENVEWKQRREVLFDMVGGITEEEVIAGDGKLSELSDLIFGISIDDFRKKLQQQLSEIKRGIEDKRPRIDELQNNIPPTEGNAESLNEKRAQLTRQLAEIKVVNPQLENQQKLSGLLAQKNELSQKLNREYTDEFNRAHAALNDCELRLRQLKGQLVTVERDIDVDITAATRRQADLQKLRADFEQVKNVPFELKTGDTRCKTCGQDLPDRDNIIKKLRDDFENNKAESLCSIKESGERLKREIGEIQKRIDRNEEIKKETEADIKSLEAQAEKAKQTFSKVQANKPTLDSNTELKAVENRITTLQTEMATSEPVSANQERENLLAQLADIDKTLAQLAERHRIKERISTLTAELMELSDAQAETERQQMLCEDYTRALAGITEDKVNSLFKTLKWKLFNRQMNGGVAETCEALIYGVPYSDANRAAKINAGLEFIEALSSRAGKRFPVWIDNSEAVNRLIDTGLQTIELRVTDEKTLRAEKRPRA